MTTPPLITPNIPPGPARKHPPAWHRCPPGLPQQWGSWLYVTGAHPDDTKHGSPVAAPGSPASGSGGGGVGESVWSWPQPQVCLCLEPTQRLQAEGVRHCHCQRWGFFEGLKGLKCPCCFSDVWNCYPICLCYMCLLSCTSPKLSKWFLL